MFEAIGQLKSARVAPEAVTAQAGCGFSLELVPETGNCVSLIFELGNLTSHFSLHFIKRRDCRSSFGVYLLDSTLYRPLRPLLALWADLSLVELGDLLISRDAGGSLEVREADVSLMGGEKDDSVFDHF